MARFVIEGRGENDVNDEPLYWSNKDGWVSLQSATIFLDTLRPTPIGECYWVRLPELETDNLVISTDSNNNWRDDLIQFARFIAELEAAGNFSDMGYVREALESMDLSPESMDELIDRAQAYWDKVKALTGDNRGREESDS